MIELSIIVPVYNTEKYLEACLESLIREAPVNSEIILVDDGSTDRSGFLCDFFQKKDNRIQVIHQVNKGLSEARNSGIKIASGEKYFFLDSDDYLTEGFFEKIKYKDVDLVISNYDAFYPDGKQIQGNYHTKLYNSLQDFLCDFHLYFATIFNFTWGKIYDARIIKRNSLRFIPGMSMVEDVFFNCDYYRNCKKILFISNAWVRYRQTAKSMSKCYNENTFDWYLISYERIRNLLIEANAWTDDNQKCYKTHFWGNVVECLYGAAKLEKGKCVAMYKKIILNSETINAAHYPVKGMKQKILKKAIQEKHIHVTRLIIMVFRFLSTFKRRFSCIWN